MDNELPSQFFEVIAFKRLFSIFLRKMDVKLYAIFLIFIDLLESFFIKPIGMVY
jgi:hypothetical protein